jgi:heme exporter protein A
MTGLEPIMQEAKGARAEQPLLQLNSISKAFGHFQALDAVSFDLQKGECLLLLGSNGAGKTTLLRILAGLTRSTRGTFTIGGTASGHLPAEARRLVGFLSHAPQLYPELSARENLRFFGKLYAVSALEQRVLELLAMIGLEARADKPVRCYSRGMQQRVSIAKALLADPPLLLLDEPYSGLDPSAARRLNLLLERFHGEGKTFVLTTHQLEMTLPFVDRVAILFRGRLVRMEALQGRKGGGSLDPATLPTLLEPYL